MAQQLPPAPGPVPDLRRLPNGEIVVVPPAPAARTENPQHPATPPTAAAPPAAVPPAPTAAPAASVPPAPASPVPGAAPAAPAPPAPAPVTAKAEISLPEPLALQLPAAADASFAAPLKALLDQASSPGRSVTYQLLPPIRPGPLSVTFTAWDGMPGASHVAATTKATLFLLPHGITPVGLSGDENATAGNNATKIARDATGRVHMVWIDGGRPGAGNRVLYRRAQVTADGSVVWETGPIRIDSPQTEAWNAYPALAVANGTVHFVWQAHGTAHYRSLPITGAAGELGPIRDTAAVSDGRDVGPAIAAGDGLIHIATPQGSDALSRDGGATWQTARIPRPAGQHTKTVSVALGRAGTAYFLMSAPVRGPTHPSMQQASGGYWQLRYAARQADGTWREDGDALAGAAGWAAPGEDGDVLADWARVLVGDDGALHVVWHGTAASRIYGNDHAYYMRRTADGRWEQPIMLVPASGHPFSFAPSLALDGAAAVAVPFYEVFDHDKFLGFDAVARIIRDGRLDETTIPVWQWLSRSTGRPAPGALLGVRFPAVAPQIYRDAQGREWLDVLETLIPAEGPKLIAYRRIAVRAGASP